MSDRGANGEFTNSTIAAGMRWWGGPDGSFQLLTEPLVMAWPAALSSQSCLVSALLRGLGLPVESPRAAGRHTGRVAIRSPRRRRTGSPTPRDTASIPEYSIGRKITH